MSNAVIPAKAGIQCMLVDQGTQAVWIPAFARMTVVGSKRLRFDLLIAVRWPMPVRRWDGLYDVR